MKSKLVFKIICFALFSSFLVILSSGCNEDQTNINQKDSEKRPQATQPQTKKQDDKKNPVIQIEMEDGGKMVFELYPEYAPKTVENFVNLTKSGFYDGLTFHRIIKNFMIQSGDPKGDGTGGSDKNIVGEFANNGYTQNILSHTRGVISMARSQNPDSASSQFFIMHGDSPQLDGNYAAFGKLTEGEKTLDKIADTPVVPSISGEMSKPQEIVRIKKVTVVSE